MEELKSFFKYLFFREMGNLGEGCLVSVFYWLVLLSIILIILSGFYTSI